MVRRGGRRVRLRLQWQSGRVHRRARPTCSSPGRTSAPHRACCTTPSSPDYARVMSKDVAVIQGMGIQNPVVGLYSKTSAQKAATLNQTMGDGLQAIIFGRADVASLDQLVKDWRAQGGDQIRSEFEQALQASDVTGGRMLTREENEALCRVGPGTLMGNLMREYWVPALLSSEVARADSRPGARPAARREADRLPRHQRPGRAHPEQLPASRRIAVLRSQRRGRPALRLPRLEVRRRRHVRRHAQRARRVRLQSQSQGGRVSRAASAAASCGPTWARARRRRRCPAWRPTCCRTASGRSRPSSASATGSRAWKATSTPATSASCTLARWPSARQQPGHLLLLHARPTARRATRWSTPTSARCTARTATRDDGRRYWRVAQFLFPFWTHAAAGRARPQGHRARLGADGRRAHHVLS